MHLSSRMHLFNIMILLLGALVCCQIAQAVVRPECSQSSVQSLHVEKVLALSSFSSSIDFCDSNSPAIPVQLENVLSEVKTVRGKVLNALGISASVLFPQDLNITVTATEGFGSLDEWADANNVYISVFSDWNGEPFDQVIFAHELGHVIAASSTNGQLIHDLKSPVLSEGFPDLIAYSTFGVGYETTGALQEILQVANRPLNTLITYNQNIAFFLETYIYDALNTCIQSLSPTDQAGSHVKSILSDVQKVESSTGFSASLALGNQPFSAETCRQLDSPSSIYGGIQYVYGCDVHQLSQPFTSFLAVLGKQLGKNLALKAAQTLASVSQIPKKKYFCAYNSAGGQESPLQIELNSFDQFINLLQTDLTPQEKSTWISLWSQAGLDAAVTIENNDLFDRIAPRAGYNSSLVQYASQTDSFYNSSNPCFGMNPPPSAAAAQCQINCLAQP